MKRLQIELDKAIHTTKYNKRKYGKQNDDSYFGMYVIAFAVVAFIAAILVMIMPILQTLLFNPNI